MRTAYQLLHLTPEIINNFALQAKLVVDEQMQRVLEKRIRELSRLSERFTESTEGVASKVAIDKVISKVKRLAKKSGADDKAWSPIELRILSYNLDQINDDAIAFDYAANLIDRNWRNLFFNGLLFYLMNDWLSPDQNHKDKICNLLKRKLNDYDGSNRRIMALKNHANFLDANGSLRMATLLAHQSKPITSAPLIFGYKESALSFSYFSDVILYYFKLQETIDVSILESVFAYHHLDRTKKLLLAMMVERVEQDGSEPLQTKVSKFAQKIFGDIALSSTWTPFPNATKEEIELLHKSKSLVNQWNARKAINTFFELCVQDPKRKKYWLKYTSFIDDFRIAGSWAVKTKLTGDKRVADIISEYFIKTNSHNGRTSALILYIRDKVFIEFSDKGAIYVYNQDHWNVSSIREDNEVSSIDDLKSTYFDKLVDHYGEVDVVYSSYSYPYYYNTIDLTEYNDEGKMFHIGYWEERLDAWMLNKLGIDCKKSNEKMPLEMEDGPIPFEKIQADIVSRWLYDKRCRVAANKDGFYIVVASTNNAFEIMKKKRDRGGDIFIIDDVDEKVVWYKDNNQAKSIIGYISIEGNFVTFRGVLSYEVKRIKL